MDFEQLLDGGERTPLLPDLLQNVHEAVERLEVIRVERDPSKPMAALSVLENLKKWKNVAMTAAQAWVTRHWQLNYEEEWVN